MTQQQDEKDNQIKAHKAKKNQFRINDADKQELIDQVTGVGGVTADAIIKARSKKLFYDEEDFMKRVKGIAQKKMDKILKQLDIIYEFKHEIFENEFDYQQYLGIKYSIDCSSLIENLRSKTGIDDNIIKEIAVFATGGKKRCAKYHCNRRIYTLHQNKDITYKYDRRTDKYYCHKCMDSFYFECDTCGGLFDHRPQHHCCDYEYTCDEKYCYTCVQKKPNFHCECGGNSWGCDNLELWREHIDERNDD
eukprot:235226_1